MSIAIFGVPKFEKNLDLIKTHLCCNFLIGLI